jgi:hypothetical protein
MASRRPGPCSVHSGKWATYHELGAVLGRANATEAMAVCGYTRRMTTDSPSEQSTERLRQWHRLFGIALMEVFEGAPWRVELEQELALRSQLLDVAIIEATGEATERGPVAERRSAPNPAQSPGRPLELPDGLENLRPHNLLTYKSRHEALNVWTLDELIGHYVNYRKLRLDATGKRHAQVAFGLYAVATRFPSGLVRTHPLHPTTL